MMVAMLFLFQLASAAESVSRPVSRPFVEAVSWQNTDPPYAWRTGAAAQAHKAPMSTTQDYKPVR